jgi:hypothetical protein
MHPERQQSLWWILFPVFLQLIGGIIAYFVLRNNDPRLAKFCIQLGLLLQFINLVLVYYLISQIPEFSQEFGVQI